MVCEGQLLEGLSLDCARDDQCLYSPSRSCPGANHRRVGVRLFYINDIITSSQKPKKQYKRFVMNYNTQLCKTALGKKFLARVTKCTCFCSKNRDRNFFRSVGQEWQPKRETSFSPRTTKNVYSIENVISEMKQTNPSSALRMTMMLGILGLGAIFVQLNELMGIFPVIIL